MASLASSARNLALAEGASARILTSCACCYGTLRHAARLLKDKPLLDKVNERLASEGLSYKGTAQVRHLFHALKEDVGIERIAHEAHVNHAFQNIVIQYGCKLLRPNLSAEFESPREGSVIEKLVKAAGANIIPWELEKDCCGSGISTTDLELANTLSHNKMASAQKAEADGVITACPFCTLQLRKANPPQKGVPILSVSELLCIALGDAGQLNREQIDMIGTRA
jgi:heterodisulfide reductase subunit B